jgi:hypothetical protein
MPNRLAVAIEAADKKAFASAVDWPGWSRSGKTPEAAIETLLAYAQRYAPVPALAGVPFDAEDLEVEIIEQSPGDATTAYGVPGHVTEADRRPADVAERERLAAIVVAAWTIFDRVARAAPAELRKGPRGGGRDTVKVVEHVIGADHGYARAMGLKLADPDPTDRKAVEALREAMLDVLRQPAEGGSIGTRWTQRYAARRIAWHALDHAWEIEDRSQS